MEAALVMFGMNWVTSRVLNEVEDVIFEVFFFLRLVFFTVGA